MIDPVTFSTAFMLGLLSSGHCIGMCGGLATTMALQSETTKMTWVNSPNRSLSQKTTTFHNSLSYPTWWHQLTFIFSIPLMFNAGRIFCYTLLGILSGSVASVMVDSLQGLSAVLRTLSGLLIIAMGLYMGQWWLGVSRLEQAGAKLWQYVQPLTRHFLPMQTVQQAFGCGLLWGFLPCGMIYATLGWATAANPSPWAGVIMLGFGLGTLPAMLFNIVLFHQLKAFLQHPWVRNGFALLLIILGLATLASNGLSEQLNLPFFNHHHDHHHTLHHAH